MTAPQREFRVVCRIKKLHDWSEIGGASNHNSRKLPAPHANPARSHLNEALYGSDDPAADVRKMHSKLTKKVRKNAVIAVEMILTAAADWFYAGRDRQANFIEAFLPALKERYRGQLANVIIHRDEEAPHLHVILVPIEYGHQRKDGKAALNCAGFFDGPEKLQELQKWAGEVGASIGLLRGEVHTGKDPRTHVPPKIYRLQMAKAAELAEIDRRKAVMLLQEAQQEKAAATEYAARVRAEGEAISRKAEEDQRVAEQALIEGQKALNRAQEVEEEAKAAAAQVRKGADAYVAKRRAEAQDIFTKANCKASQAADNRRATAAQILALDAWVDGDIVSADEKGTLIVGTGGSVRP